MKSWKRTTAAITGILGLVATAITAALDDNPATVPQWEIVIPAVITQLGLLVGHFSASSKPETPPKE
jgi:hypothetical protein